MSEITDEWLIGNVLPHIDGLFQVQLLNDDVRTARRYLERDFSSLWFTDCTHPEQNMYCDPSSIKAWRLVRGNV